MRALTGSPIRLAVSVAGLFIILFCWVFGAVLLSGNYLSESDLYEYYLPVFLAPMTTWSAYEFGGLPAFADPGDFTLYPPHFFFARVVGSWTGLAISAYVLAACFTVAYVRHVTRSWWAAIFAGLAFSLSEAMMERLPHMSTLHAFAWLPLIVLAVDRLRGDAPSRWLAIGAFAIGCCFLAGHPQPAFYTYYVCGAYALAGGIAEKASRGYYVRLLAMFVLGGVLAAVKGIPLVEASFHLTRQVVDFGQFISRTNGLVEMISALFPTVVHDGREAPLYVGLVTLSLAGLGVVQARRNWRVAFWLVVAVIALLVGAGEATPVARLVYSLPLMDKFRVAARLLVVASFGIVVLAAYGVAAAERRQVSVRASLIAAGAIVLLVAAAATLMLQRPAIFAFEPRTPLPWPMPLWNTGVWVQLAIAAASAIAIVQLAGARRVAAVIGFICALVAVDLLYSLPHPIGVTGVKEITIPPRDAQPSVHALQLAQEMAPQQQRLLAIGGTHRDAVVPAVFARLWRIPIAGGYGPMLLARHNEMALMGNNGSASPELLAGADSALDLLAVKYLVTHDGDFAAAATFERKGIAWEKAPLEFTIGRPDCGHAYPRKTSIALPADVRISSIAFVAHLRCAEHVPQGTEVAQLELMTGDGVVRLRPLVAGVDIAERGLGDPETRARAKHTAARLADDPDLPQVYLSRVELPRPAAATRLGIEAAGIGGWMTIERLTVIDENGHSWPLKSPEMFLRDATRWREVRRFRTSRASDRDHDENAPGEEEYVVYENLRARPRAWIASSVVELPESDMVASVHASQLPDGRPFDPALTALVDPGAVTDKRFAPGRTSARVSSIEDGRIEVSVTTEGGGFLVLSEAYYPGWRARIGGQTIPVLRTDVSLQGVPVPAGQQTVVFELASNTQRAGAATSVVGLAIALALVWRGFRL